jgi:hypothetical protein
MPLVLKMRCNWIKQLGSPIYDGDHPTDEHKIVCVQVQLTPVGHSMHGSDSDFAAKCNGGLLELSIVDPEVMNCFKPGRCYSITIDHGTEDA